MTGALRPLRSPRGRLTRVSIVWAALCCAAVVARAALDTPFWSGWLPTTVVFGSDLAVLTGVGGAALGAWLVLPLAAGPSAEWSRTGARSRSQLLLPALGVAVGSTCGGALAGVAALGAWSWWSGGIGVALPVLLLWCAGTALAIGSLAAFGCLLAWWLRHPSAVVVAAGLAYLVIVAPQYTLDPPPWSYLAPAVGEAWTETAPTPAGATARAALWLGVGGAITALLCGRLRLAWLAGVGCSLGLAAGLLLAPAHRDLPGADEVRCRDGRPTICTRAVWSAGLTRSTAIVVQGYAVLPDEVVPTVLGTDEGAGLAGAPPDAVFQPRGGTTAPTNVPDRAATVAALGDTAVGGRCRRANQAQLALLTWWRLAHALPLDKPVTPGDFVPQAQLDPATVDTVVGLARRLQALPRPDRDRWFVEHWQAVQRCTLTTSDFP